MPRIRKARSALATGPAGPASCDADRLLVCPDADLPDGEYVEIRVDGTVLSAYAAPHARPSAMLFDADDWQLTLTTDPLVPLPTS